MSPTPSDNLGRRRYLLHRDKAVEHALERIRHAEHSQWETLTAQELAGLKGTLAEIWENSSRERWHQYCFSTLTKPNLLKLITHGHEIRAHHHLTSTTREAIETILLSCSGNHLGQ